jgi:hypothetical protein
MLNRSALYVPKLKESRRLTAKRNASALDGVINATGNSYDFVNMSKLC